MATMKAVRFHAARDIRVEDIPVPQVKPGWVRIKPAFVGICGSDLHEYEDGPYIIPPAGSPHGMTGEAAPVTLGHEFSGVIDQVGDGVDGFAVGDKVCVQPILYDGDCNACNRGLWNCCQSLGCIGMTGYGGGMGEYTTAPSINVKKLPSDMALDLGALVEPLATAWHAVSTSPFKPGDDVLVLGAGPIGLAVVMSLVAKGCTNIIVSEVSRKRREYAKSFGAHHIIDPAETDVLSETNKLTNGGGIDLCFDAAGVQAAVNSGLQSVKPRGTFCNIALWGSKRVALDMMTMIFGERRYMAVVAYLDEDFEAVIAALHSGKLKPQGMVTKVIRPDQVAEEGFRALVEEKDKQIKILVDMSQAVGS